ncbi:hypothetical protein ACOME3_000863 [Neoechinorhynchus agilis]
MQHFRRFILPLSRQNPPSLFTFDALHTLIRLKGPTTIDPNLLAPTYIRAWREMKANAPCYGVNQAIQRWWHHFVEKALETNVAELEQRKEIASYLHTELRKAEHWHLLDGAVDVVRRLAEHGVELGIVSNCDDRLPSLLDELGLYQYFKFIYTPINMKIEKPNPEIFERVLDGREHLLTYGTGIHIGDELMADYIAPRQVGLKSILLTNSNDHFWIRDKVESMRDLSQCLFDQ